MILLFKLPCDAGRTRVYHCAQPLIEIGSHEPFSQAGLELWFSQSPPPRLLGFIGFLIIINGISIHKWESKNKFILYVQIYSTCILNKFSKYLHLIQILSMRAVRLFYEKMAASHDFVSPIYLSRVSQHCTEEGFFDTNNSNLDIPFYSCMTHKWPATCKVALGHGHTYLFTSCLWKHLQSSDMVK
jgi:hypothetical protein